MALAPAGSTSAGDDAPRSGRHLLQTRRIWTEFDDPSSPNGWYSGELLHNGNFDPARAEVARQLDAMQAMGVDEIVYELRSGDPVWPPQPPPLPSASSRPTSGCNGRNRRRRS